MSSFFLSFPGSAGLYSEIRRSQAFWSYLMPFKMLLLFIQILIFVSCCASILSTLFFACTKHIFFLHFNLPISQIHYMLSYIFTEVNSIFECRCCFSYLLQLCIPGLFNISLNGRNTVLLTAPCLSLFQGDIQLFVLKWVCILTWFIYCTAIISVMSIPVFYIHYWNENTHKCYTNKQTKLLK